MKYFLDNLDNPWAVDENGNEFAVGKGGKLFPVEKGTVDLYWSGVTEAVALSHAA